MIDDDTSHMRSALALARRGLGNTWPNPSVGCVIVRNNRVVGRAVTAPGGRPHAEPQALAMAGASARGATAYVTLEPCCHHGRTPPCTDALIGAGIARVVIAARDPDPRVNGQGVAKLRAAGIAVEEGVLAGEAAEILAGFHQRTTTGRPLVTLKLASTLDGRIATHSGESRWITGEPARRAAHVLRGRHDAILVGVGTVIADDPDLTCRLPGFRPTRIVRVVADSHLRTSMTSRLVATARETPTWMLIRHGTDATRRHAFADRRHPADRNCRRRGRGGFAGRPVGARHRRDHPAVGGGRRTGRGCPIARRIGGPHRLVSCSGGNGRRRMARGAGVRHRPAGRDAPFHPPARDPSW